MAFYQAWWIILRECGILQLKQRLQKGKILGYGDLLITSDVKLWTNAELKINWYVKDAEMPSSDKFSIVISCATSLRGDYLTGCKSNKMWVDDFKWVY